MLQYDPKQCTVILGGNILEGWSDGTFINVERNKDTYSLKVGVDGRGTRAKSNDKSGRVTLTFHQSSRSNDILAALAQLDERVNLGAVPFLLRDAGGRTVVTALTIWVVKPAPIEFTGEVSDRAWVLESDSLEIFVGGN